MSSSRHITVVAPRLTIIYHQDGIHDTMEKRNNHEKNNPKGSYMMYQNLFVLISPNFFIAQTPQTLRKRGIYLRNIFSPKWKIKVAIK